jgi:hypothetical protein
VTKDARHVLVVPSGPLTALPFHLLVTEKPSAAIPQLKDIGAYRDAASLIKRQAVSVLPALASLKALRGGARRGPGTKPLVGFGDPVFDPAERAAPPGPASPSPAATATSGKAQASTGRRSPARCRRCSTPPMNSRPWPRSSALRPAIFT